MGQQQSKDELLYQKAIIGDIQAVKALSSDGAGLEWIDKEGKTPLVVACLNFERYNLAKTLIELGANVNVYRPGRHAGTPLHHAAKRGLDRTARLLLSHGANLFARNDDCQTPLDVARFRGFTNVARLIEGHICFFSGWLREFYGPGFLEVLAPKLLSRKIWAVVIPCVPHNPAKPLKLELAIYSNIQDAQPRAVIPLWKADIEEPKLNLQDPTLIIFDKPTGIRYRFAASNDGDKQQIQAFYLACRGIPQVMHIPLAPDSQASPPTDSTQTAEEAELAMTINASLHSGTGNRPSSTQTSEPDNLNGWAYSTDNTNHNEWGPASDFSPPEASSSGWKDEQSKEQHNGWGLPEQKPNHSTQTSKTDTLNGWLSCSNNTTHNGWGPANESSPPKASDWVDEPTKEQQKGWGLPEPKVDKNKFQANFVSASPQSSGGVNEPCKEMYNGWRVNVPKSAEHNTEVTFMPQLHNVPSAPPIPMEGLDEGPIWYPSTDFSSVNLSGPCLDNEEVGTKDQVKDEDSSSSCVICWEAPVEGACVPCGHMAGCMACLDEVKTKKGDCPVCRTKINQVIRIYAV